jgi:hypothetical protein
MARQQLGRVFLQCVKSAARTTHRQTLSAIPALGGLALPWHTGYQTRSCSSKGKHHLTHPALSVTAPRLIFILSHTIETRSVAQIQAAAAAVAVAVTPFKAAAAAQQQQTHWMTSSAA